MEWIAVVVMVLLFFAALRVGWWMGQRSVEIRCKDIQLGKVEGDFVVPMHHEPGQRMDAFRNTVISMAPALMRLAYVTQLPMLDIKQRRRYRVTLYVGHRKIVELQPTNGKEKKGVVVP